MPMGALRAPYSSSGARRRVVVGHPNLLVCTAVKSAPSAVWVAKMHQMAMSVVN